MAITSSEIESNALQISGLRDVTELHIDHVGQKHRFRYSVPGGMNLSNRMNARIQGIEALIKRREINAAVNAVMRGFDPTLYWATWLEVKPALLRRKNKKVAEYTKVSNQIQNINDKLDEIGD